MITEKDLNEFKSRIRLETLKCLRHRGFGHVGGSMSVVEVLAALYGDVMKINPGNPGWHERDYLIMSKGHAGPALFATLALKGFFPVEWLNTLCEPGTKLPSHCDRLKTPGVDITTGSLGQGLSIAAGIGQGFKIRNMKNRVYVILGDGELGEGQNWEAAQFISHYNLNNVTAIIDWNKRQVDGYCKNIMNIGDIAGKFKAFGWDTETVDGKDVYKIREKLLRIKDNSGKKACVLILDGIKGSGVPEYEDMFDNHFFTLDSELATDVISRLENEIVQGVE